jgi:putative flippase GtrA
VAVNALVVRMLLDTLPIALNQAVASMTVLFVGYALNKRWTFNDRSN